jgi:hypothetical protein
LLVLAAAPSRHLLPRQVWPIFGRASKPMSKHVLAFLLDVASMYPGSWNGSKQAIFTYARVTRLLCFPRYDASSQLPASKKRGGLLFSCRAWGWNHCMLCTNALPPHLGVIILLTMHLHLSSYSLRPSL